MKHDYKSNLNYDIDHKSTYFSEIRELRRRGLGKLDGFIKGAPLIEDVYNNLKITSKVFITNFCLQKCLKFDLNKAFQIVTAVFKMPIEYDAKFLDACRPSDVMPKNFFNYIRRFMDHYDKYLMEELKLERPLMDDEQLRYNRARGDKSRLKRAKIFEVKSIADYDISAFHYPDDFDLPKFQKVVAKTLHQITLSESGIKAIWVFCALKALGMVTSVKTKVLKNLKGESFSYSQAFKLLKKHTTRIILKYYEPGITKYTFREIYKKHLPFLEYRKQCKLLFNKLVCKTLLSGGELPQESISSLRIMKSRDEVFMKMFPKGMASIIQERADVLELVAKWRRKEEFLERLYCTDWKSELRKVLHHFGGRLCRKYDPIECTIETLIEPLFHREMYPVTRLVVIDKRNKFENSYDMGIKRLRPEMFHRARCLYNLLNDEDKAIVDRDLGGEFVPPIEVTPDVIDFRLKQERKRLGLIAHIKKSEEEFEMKRKLEFEEKLEELAREVEMKQKLEMKKKAERDAKEAERKLTPEETAKKERDEIVDMLNKMKVNSELNHLRLMEEKKKKNEFRRRQKRLEDRPMMMEKMRESVIKYIEEIKEREAKQKSESEVKVETNSEDLNILSKQSADQWIDDLNKLEIETESLNVDKIKNLKLNVNQSVYNFFDDPVGKNVIIKLFCSDQDVDQIKLIHPGNNRRIDMMKSFLDRHI
jgi:ribosomal protein L22